MHWAWEQRLAPSLKLVLMALADAADDEGQCWPSVRMQSHSARSNAVDPISVHRIASAKALCCARCHAGAELRAACEPYPGMPQRYTQDMAAFQLHRAIE
ncbi:MAG: helix-turn-helix domain-containing protein [Acidobacteriota bacterium]